MRRLKALASVPVLLLLAVFAAAQTQSTTGVIQGTVSDSSGAVVAGAHVEITNVDTNLKRTYTTDSDGRFVALSLPPGNYTVNVSKSGFAAYKQEKINVMVGNAVNLTPRLGVSGGSTVVNVTSTPDIDPTKTESSSTLNERTIAQTPVLGRKFEDLLTLTPGVSVVQGPDGDEINFNGQRGVFNNVSLDGGDYNNGFFGEQSGGQRAAVDITMDAIKEFQVISAGSSAEFGRTAGGVINVVTKSGTNDLHGSLFYYYRGEGLSSNTSDGKPLKDFNRNQFGATIGGPIKRDKAFFFLAVEQITANLQRDNLSTQVGPAPCPTATPAFGTLATDAVINGNIDCQRLALVNFIQATRGTNEALPLRRPKHNTAVLGKVDFNLSPRHTLSISHNFDSSRNVNETFDVPTYGTSANGVEGTSFINATNVNLVSTLTNNLVNEAHFSYNNETRPRAASPSNVPADTAMGFGTTFRFGNPFFLGPTVDETFKRFDFKDNISWIKGKHTFKFGGEWLHSNNAQVFRGFFEGRYIFSDPVGFLRYASPQAAGGFGPSTQACSNGTYITSALGEVCPALTTNNGTPLLLYLQGAAGNLGPATDAAGASNISNEDPSLFVQDKWQVRPNFTLSLGVRWEAQIFPQPTVDPAKTIYGPFLSNPLFPSNGKLPSQYGMIQPRLGFAWDLFSNSKSVLRASWGIFNAHQNMLTQVGSITTNGVQQATIAGGLFANPGITPTWPNLYVAAPLPPGTFPLFSGVRVFDKDYRNPRIYTTNVAFEQAFDHNITVYIDFTHSKGVYLTNFLNYTRTDRLPFFGFMFPLLNETDVTSSRANSLYRGAVFGLRKRFSNHFQADVNYTWSSDWDNDSNERDPFTDRSGPATATDPFPLRKDYSPSDRDIRHKFNFLISGDMPWGFQGNLRIQARSAQPITDPACGKRNCARKDNQFASIDWRLARPFHFGDRYAIIPTVEMFNMANAANNVNPLISPGLFNFDGYLRQGVGDPRQVQLSVKFTF